MIIPFSEPVQDTVKGRNIVLNDSLDIISDSISVIIESDSVQVVELLQQKDSVIQKPPPAPKKTVSVFKDTISVCIRNRIADITFYDTNNVVAQIAKYPLKKFPYSLIEKNKRIKTEAKEILIKHLKTGQDMPYQLFHDDWIIGIIMVAAFLYSLISTTSKRLLPGVSRFLFLRGINDPSSREIDGVFTWQSTILNFISFLIISLFGYFAASYNDFTPFGINGILFWILSFGIVISAFTLRHITCAITGDLSGEKEAFREYLISVYHSYWSSALFLFVIIILMSYTAVLPARISLTAGLIVVGIMYLIRILRLIKIFLDRNISIFYLILYLCALELLPVLILVKYFTGLI